MTGIITASLLSCNAMADSKEGLLDRIINAVTDDSKSRTGETEEGLLDRIINAVTDGSESGTDETAEELIDSIFEKLDSAYQNAKAKTGDSDDGILSYLVNMIDEVDFWESVEQIVELFSTLDSDYETDTMTKTETPLIVESETTLMAETEAIPETETEVIPETETEEETETATEAKAEPKTASETETETEAETEAAAKTVIYEVRQGDCLWAIANSKLGAGRRYLEIAKANDLNPPYEIAPGQELLLPAE